MKKVYRYEVLDSTNEEAKRIAAREKDFHGSLIITKDQTGGKGRRGRSWLSPKGTTIAMSLLLKPEIAPDNASMLTLVAALAVNQAIREVTGLPALIKWPNDIVVNAKKVCGILTEMSVDMTGIQYVVVGIGINVNQMEFPEELLVSATSLRKESGMLTDREELITKIVEYFQHFYEIFIETENLESLYGVYNKQLVNIDKQVKLLLPGQEKTGIARGINMKGELLVTGEDGKEMTIASGEVSVRGLYGYV